MVHALKTASGVFDDVKYGKKNFEIRKNDRDFKVGDTLNLQEFNRNEGNYTGEEFPVEVTYIFKANEHSLSYGLMPDYCVMAIKPIDQNA